MEISERHPRPNDAVPVVFSPLPDLLLGCGGTVDYLASLAEGPVGAP